MIKKIRKESMPYKDGYRWQVMINGRSYGITITKGEAEALEKLIKKGIRR